jgi:RND family efflux transporter MFP subunit
MPVRTVSVVQQDDVDLIGATAITEASETASIWIGVGVGLRDTGVRIEAMHVVEGQEVQQDQVLVELEDDLFIQAVKRQEMAVAAARAELDSMQQLRREQAATGLQLRHAEMQFEMAQLQLQLAQRDLERCEVRSPMQGFADMITTMRGEEVDTGREFTKIHRLDPIHVRVDFPQERLDDVFLGQSAEVVLDSFPKETFQARVIRIAPLADPETRVLPVVLEMANPECRIRAGLTGFARLKVHRQALVIPRIAVNDHAEKAMVFRVDQGRSKLQEVRLGDTTEIGSVEVLSGLREGDEVVVFGSEFLRDGDSVNAEWRQWAGRN